MKLLKEKLFYFVSVALLVILTGNVVLAIKLSALTARGSVTPDDDFGVTLQENGRDLTNAEVNENHILLDALGYAESVMNYKVKLMYKSENGMMQTLDTTEGYYNNGRYEFSGVRYYGNSGYTYEDIRNMLKEQTLDENLGIIINLVNFYKAYTSGQTNVDLRLPTPDGKGKDISISGASFEDITGYTLSEFEESVLKAYNEYVVGKNESGDTSLNNDDRDVPFVVDGETVNLKWNKKKRVIMSESGVFYLKADSRVSIHLPGDTKTLPPAGINVDKEGNRILGEYLVYYPEHDYVKKSDLRDSGNCVPLVKDGIYELYGSGNVTFIKVDVRTIGGSTTLYEVLDSNAYISSMDYTPQSRSNSPYSQVQPVYIKGRIPDVFTDTLPGMISRFIVSNANGINFLLQSSLKIASGGLATVDIDSLVFDNYPDTQINYFGTKLDGSPANQPSKMVSLFRQGVNQWYPRFKMIAIFGYLVILLYVGIRILTSVGGQKQAQFKEMLVYWVSGLLILEFFPYAVKAGIQINLTFVKMIENSKSEILHITDQNIGRVDISDFDYPDIDTTTETGKALAAQMEKNPFSQNDKTYMAEMARMADTNSNIANAVVYLVMVIQLVMLVIVYYRRVFTIAFLMMIFPFVALTYTLDKIGDGKSQSFETWTKEMFINIFVQSIHAIVYVFVVGATYIGGSYNGDWLLSIVGVSFLFQGEQILKKLLGQNGETVRSLADTASRTIATISATRAIGSQVGKGFSHIGSAWRYNRERRKEELILRNFDYLKPNTAAAPITSLNGYNSAYSTDDEYNQLARDLQTLRNLENETDMGKYASALNNVLSKRETADMRYRALIEGSGISKEQLDSLATAQQNLVRDVARAGKERDAEKQRTLRQKADHNLQIALQQTFHIGGENLDKMTRAMYMQLRDGDKERKHQPRNVEIKDIQAEWKVAKEKKATLDSSKTRQAAFMQYMPSGNNKAFSNASGETALSSRAQATQNRVMNTYFASVSDEDKQRYAQSLAIISDFRNSGARNSTKYTARQVMNAAEYVKQHENDSKAHNIALKNLFVTQDGKAINLTGDDIMSYVSQRVRKEYSDENQKEFAQPEITDGTAIEKHVAENRNKEAWEKATEYLSEQREKNKTADDVLSVFDVIRFEGMVKTAKEDVRKNAKKEYEAANDERMQVYNSSLTPEEQAQKAKELFDLQEKLEKVIQNPEVDEAKLEDSYLSFVKRDREKKSEFEINAVEDFAAAKLEQMGEANYEKEFTYDGLTQSEHEARLEALKSKVREETFRSATTAAFTTVGAVAGTGIEIGLSDDNSALEEAATGVVAGMGMGAAAEDFVMGSSEKFNTVEIKVINPYTGEEEVVKVKKYGLLRDSNGRLDKNEVYEYNSEKLQNVRAEIDVQFLKSKQKMEKEAEMKRRKNLYQDAINMKNNT